MSDGTCPTCGGSVTRLRPTGPIPTYCSTECRRVAAKPRAAERARELAAERKAERPDRQCADCGGTIPGAASLKRIYCSRSCSNRASKKRLAEQGRPCAFEGCERSHRAKGFCAYHYKVEFYPDWRTRWPEDPEKRRKGLRKKTQLRRARLRDSEAESIDRDDIGERDGWRCGLCGKKVNRTLAYPHPRSPSLDHIVPLSLGGRHASENVQISHLECNHAKGNRGGGEQLLLIG